MKFKKIKITMKKFIITQTLFVFFATIAFSQVIDKQAEAILDGVSKKMQSFNTIHIEFTYIMEHPDENIKESKKGSIYVEGDKYRLYIADQLVISDGQTVWTYFKDGNEVQINEVDPNDENTPMKMLTTYDKNYRPKLIREVPKAGKTIQILDLTPNKTQSFFKIRLEVDKATQLLVSSTIYDKNGSTFSYVVDNMRENPRIHPSRFTFNRADYPGVIVTDMR
jgi:outer membrane lipoprotein carrier protein